MIYEVRLKRFKKFSDQTFELKRTGISICAGPNSSGKSTLLHALAVWSFGVMVIRQFKGGDALLQGYNGQGAGLSKDDFTPVNIPDLRHLWYDLKSQVPHEGYSMTISVKWNRGDDEKRLTVAFSLVQDRLYVKALESNLQDGDRIPNIVYLPPVAGVDAREEFATHAKRRAMLGRGLAGSVLRNFLLDLEENNRKIRSEKKGGKAKISSKDLEDIRANDPWESLNEIMRDVFRFDLRVTPFDADFHTVINVDAVPKERSGNKWKRVGASKDLMVEGAGAQQWLTVFSFALAPDTDVLLLDEPDAHLFSALKVDMVDRLCNIARTGPQILMATHATEILKRHDLGRIISFGYPSPKYLCEEKQRAKLITGLGDDYAPLIEKARMSRFILFVENESDARILAAMCKTLGILWPEKIAIHATTEKHGDRLKFYRHLLGAIDGLKAISIRDRDDAPINTVNEADLCDKGVNVSAYPDFKARTWLRREIENYALVAQALSEVVGEEETRNWWNDRGWAWPQDMGKDEHLLNCDIKAQLDAILPQELSTEDFMKTFSKDFIHEDLRKVICEISEIAN